MNLYAIFVGAFFIAYYNVSRDNNSNFVSIVVIIGGFIATVGWFCSLLGYYSWLISWTNILIFHENNLVKENKNHRVYSMIEKTYLTNTGFSTQKITKAFIFIVMILWLCILGYQIYQVYKNNCECAFYIAFSFPLLFAGFVWGLILLFRKNLMSNIDSHYILHQEREGTYEIKEPTK